MSSFKAVNDRVSTRGTSLKKAIEWALVSIGRLIRHRRLLRTKKIKTSVRQVDFSQKLQNSSQNSLQNFSQKSFFALLQISSCSD